MTRLEQIILKMVEIKTNSGLEEFLNSLPQREKLAMECLVDWRHGRLHFSGDPGDKDAIEALRNLKRDGKTGRLSRLSKVDRDIVYAASVGVLQKLIRSTKVA
jgi:hypothetical protein